MVTFLFLAGAGLIWFFSGLDTKPSSSGSTERKTWLAEQNERVDSQRFEEPPLD